MVLAPALLLSPQEEASRDQTDRKGSEEMEGSEAELAAEEGKTCFVCPGEEDISLW